MYTKSQMTSKLAAISRSTKSIRKNVQTVLIHAAAHAYQNNDPVYFEKLFANASGLNRKKLTSWAQEYGFVRIQKDGSFKLNKRACKDAEFANGDEVVEYLTENAPAWYADEESASQVKADLDVAKRVKSLASQIQNARDNGKGLTVNPAEVKAALDELQTAIADTADSVEPANVEPSF